MDFVKKQGCGEEPHDFAIEKGHYRDVSLPTVITNTSTHFNYGQNER